MPPVDASGKMGTSWAETSDEPNEETVDGECGQLRCPGHFGCGWEGL